MSFKRAIQSWTEENTPVGRALGYPECCILEFCQQSPALLKSITATKDDKRRYKAACIDGKFTGFVPCKKHAKDIISGKIKLSDLVNVTKRDPQLPKFPLF